MVLVGVCKNNPQDVVGMFLDERGVGQNDLDPRRGLIAEGHADIDDDPLAIVRRTVAVAVEVHPDLVRAAERQEYEFVVAVGLHEAAGAELRRQISKSPRMVKSWSKISILEMAPSNSDATPP